MPRRLNTQLALAFAVLLTVSFPRLSWWPAAYFALYPLMVGIYRSRSVWQAFLFSYFSGFLFLLLSLFWVRHVTLAGLIIFALLDSLAFGLFGALAKNLFNSYLEKRTTASVSRSSFTSHSEGRRPEESPSEMLRSAKQPSQRVAQHDRTYETSSTHVKVINILLLLFSLPSIWVVQEFIRVNVPVIGFGFNLLGHSQAAFPLAAQIARLVGDYGVSFFLALVNTAVFLLLLNVRETEKLTLTWGQRAFVIILTLVFAVCVFAYGVYRMGEPPRGDVIRIGVIQGNIPQDDKWDLASKPLIIEKYKKLTLLAKYDGPELLIWSEAAWPGYFNLEYGIAGFDSFLGELNVPILLGSPHYENENSVYNSAYLVQPGLGIVGRYDKVNLVPFGEYVPFGSFFRVFGVEQYARAMGVSDFAFGQANQKLFELVTVGAGLVPAPEGRPQGPPLQPAGQPHKFATLICFEDGFSHFTRRLVDAGAQFILVITNDAWFKNSAGPYQHLYCSVMRAIENGIYVVRSANTGVSCFINPKGIVEDRVENGEGNDIFVAGGLTRPIFASSAKTPFREVGYLFPYLCLILSFPALYPRGTC